MLIGSTILIGLLLLMSVVQVAFALKFSALMQARPEEAGFAGQDPPLVSVLLPLRGADPGLENSLCCLLDQDYPNYEIIAVIDHVDDPAWAYVSRTASGHASGTRLRFFEMKNPDPARSLKCHSLLQAVEQTADESEIIVLVDSDVTVHRGWLKSVVAPLADEQIGVVTGNQWFEPSSNRPGSLLRSLWNAGALVPTVMFRNPWAGTCAMRRSQMSSSGLLDAWSTSIVDDGPIRESMNREELEISFQPSLMMINRDECSVGYVFQYITRMLTWSRLYESTFVMTVVHAVVTFLMLAGALLFCVLLLSAGWSTPFFALLSALGLYSLANTAGYVLIRGAVNRAVDYKLAPLQPTRILLLILLAVAIQLIYSAACFCACFKRSVVWRQIEYRISGGKVRMLSYQPFRKNDGAADSI